MISSMVVKAGGGTVTLGGLWEHTVTDGVIVDVSHYAGPGGEAAMAIHAAGVDTVVVPFTDNLGSTIATWDTSTGAVDRRRYFPYGEIRQSDGLDTAVGFTGQRHDPSGLMYYQARYYDPHTGRFTQADSIVAVGGTNPQALNRYTYVDNNPVNFTDPTGHDLCPGDGGGCESPRRPSPVLRGLEFVSPNGLIDRVLSGETPIGSVGLCGEFEVSAGVGGQGQGCLMATVDGDIYFVVGAGPSASLGVSEATTGGVILSSGGGPGFWPDAGVSGCVDVSAGAGPGGGVAVCSGLISTNGVDLGDWAIEIFGGQVIGASASVSAQAWVSVNLPDWGPGPSISVEGARAALATMVR